MEVPFNTHNHLYTIKGYNKLLFKGIKTVERVECAVFEGNFDISKSDIPQKLKKKYNYSLQGKGKHYFDIRKRQYFGADVEISEKTLIDTENINDLVINLFTQKNSIHKSKIRLDKVEILK